MTFVSYAQNFEDAMLWRALKHVPQGLYVDIGAQDPVVDSVSRAFYENGWRGVHIEPVQHYADLLRKNRPDETVLQMALSDTDGVLELNVIAETGLSTAVAAVAERHLAESGFGSSTVRVPMLPLKSALKFLDGKELHWLKIDVEGFEANVLRGWDASALRPWIMVIEATKPGSPETDHESWDHLVIGSGYRFVYFDGLNRFYVAEEHPELFAAFAAPPNVFDEVRLSGLASSELCRGVIERYQGQIEHYQGEIAALQAERDAAVAAVGHGGDAERARGVAELELKVARDQVARLETEMAGLREFGRLAAHIEWLERQHGDAERETERLHHHIAWMQKQLDGAVQNQNYAAHQLAVVTDTAQRHMHAVHASTSWRVTAPLRRAVELLRRLRGQPVHSAVAATPAPPVPVAASDEPLLRELSPRATTILAQIQRAIDSKES
jgi:FkbM family methyltransferase